METEEQLKFKAMSEDGEVLDCEALFLYEDPKTHRNFIAYTDHQTDSEGCTKVYASVYDPKDLESSGGDYATLPLSPLEDEEWPIVEKVLEELQGQVEAEAVNIESSEAKSSAPVYRNALPAYIGRLISALAAAGSAFKAALG